MPPCTRRSSVLLSLRRRPPQSCAEPAPSDRQLPVPSVPSSSASSQSPSVASTPSPKPKKSEKVPTASSSSPGADEGGKGEGGTDDGSAGKSPWYILTVADGYLRLSQTLPSGQAFRWRYTGKHPHIESPTNFADQWVGSIEHRLYVLRQATVTDSPTEATSPSPSPDGPVWYRVVVPSPCPDADVVLRDYFRADIDFSASYARFRASDSAFDRTFRHLSGLRTLRQPPEECLFAFICSSNNNVKRISTMVSHLAEMYGAFLANVENEDYYAFPSIETLAQRADEKTLRDNGFGYRAKFIVPTAVFLAERAKKEGVTSRDMLLSWRALSRAQVAQRLTQYPGVGRKVAGCIALMAMDQLGEIPVDTHVWQIAKRYRPELETKSLTMRVYEDVGDWFRERFGEDDAGVAHNFLFVGELPDFRKLMAKEGDGFVESGEAMPERDGKVVKEKREKTSPRGVTKRKKERKQRPKKK